ncbi:Uncharacterised protein [Mycobacteroides abscessus subsp. abscessus]|nr:Uncharacterised protein [Mycobacteroides abscessus subsp. abscessus]
MSLRRSSESTDPSAAVIIVLPTPPLPPNTAREWIPRQGLRTTAVSSRSSASSRDSPGLMTPKLPRYTHLRQPADAGRRSGGRISERSWAPSASPMAGGRSTSGSCGGTASTMESGPRGGNWDGSGSGWVCCCCCAAASARCRLACAPSLMGMMGPVRSRISSSEPSATESLGALTTISFSTRSSLAQRSDSCVLRRGQRETRRIRSLVWPEHRWRAPLPTRV